VTDTNAAAARRWIAERLLWERFLEQTVRAADGTEPAEQRPAA
jgi:hypothetical protein